ncbi:MAG: hypothetical protein IPO98_18270 [Saprospiraceae bacterium]|nr:hypothetical protein [Saprospiraceae bacterium]
MKNRWILTSVLILLSVLAYYLYKQKILAGNSMVKADRGFTVSDIRSVSKIVIKHVKLQPLVFTRDKAGWIVNGKYQVDPAVFLHVEKVLTDITMLYIPPTNSIATILKSIKNNGIQVDVYTDSGSASKIIHIGSDIQSGDGTFMVLGGSKQPYAMHLSGLAGGIRSRFEQPLENFRNKFIYQYNSDDIDFVKVDYPKNNIHSFIINNHGSVASVHPVVNRDEKNVESKTNVIKSYLEGFENLGAEKLMNSYPLRDSVLSTIPGCIIELKDKGGKVVLYKYYPFDDFENGTGPSSQVGELRFQNRMFVLVDNLDFILFRIVYLEIYLEAMKIFVKDKTL